VGGLTANSRNDPYEVIYQRIVEGTYQPGQRLIEQRLAEDLEVSRTPVREALRRLEAGGLIVVERNRGAVVREVSRSELIDLYELRARLEALAAERAAARATVEDLDSMEMAVVKFASIVERAHDGDIGTVREIAEWNRRFHDSVVAAAKHQRLAEVLRVTVDAPLVFRSFRGFSHVESARSEQFHRLIFHAISDRDGQRASRLMQEHIDQGRDVLLRGFDAGDGRHNGGNRPS
jgi:DNA-binding GntR family transcriptional regulator